MWNNIIKKKSLLLSQINDDIDTRFKFLIWKNKTSIHTVRSSSNKISFNLNRIVSRFWTRNEKCLNVLYDKL